MRPHLLLGTVAALTLTLVSIGVPVGASPAPPSAPIGDLSLFVLDLDDGVRDLEVTIASLDGSTSEIESEDEVDIVLAADVFFAFGEATLTAATSQALAGLAEQLRERASGQVAVVGHTYGVGSTAANLQLSLARAQAVVTALTPQVPGLQLVAGGKGETEPFAVETVEGKDDPAARAQNRRVAITYQKA